MKKLWLCGGVPLICLLAGCETVGSQSTSLSSVYGAVALLSLALFVGCCLLVREKKLWFLMLFASVVVVNVGYTLLSLSTNLTAALWANRLSYFGSVFLPLSMLMILLDVTATPYRKRHTVALLCTAAVVFLIAASPGILPVYYKEVTLAVEHGVTTLDKVYGPLHCIYLIYLLGYFTTMVVVIIRAWIKKTLESTAHAVMLAIAVLVNIGVWLIEQLTHITFEFLSVSYIISESFPLGIYLVMQENKRLREIVRQVELVSSDPPPESVEPVLTFTPERMESYLSGVERLTPTEKLIYESYISCYSAKEVMAELNIKENTLKYHNRNIYGKLGVGSRKELLEINRQITLAKFHQEL